MADKNLEQSKPQVLPLSDSELLSLDIPDIVWFYKNLISSPSLIALSGAPGSYKTFFALWIAKRLSSDPPLPLFSSFDKMSEDAFGLDLPDEPVPTLFIEEEMNQRQMKKRTAMFNTEQMNSPHLYHLIMSGLKTNNKFSLETIAEIIKSLNIKLVILDPFTSVIGLEDENSNAEASKAMDTLRRTFITELSTTVLFLHHPSKGDKSSKNLRGAGDILGKVDMHLSMEKVLAERGRALVSYEKCRDFDKDSACSFFIDLREMDADTDTPHSEFCFVSQEKKAHEQTDKAERREEIKQEILEALLKFGNGKATKSSVAEYIGISPRTASFTEPWNELKNANVIYMEPSSKKWHIREAPL